MYTVVELYKGDATASGTTQSMCTHARHGIRSPPRQRESIPSFEFYCYRWPPFPNSLASVLSVIQPIQQGRVNNLYRRGDAISSICNFRSHVQKYSCRKLQHRIRALHVWEKSEPRNLLDRAFTKRAVGYHVHCRVPTQTAPTLLPQYSNLVRGGPTLQMLTVPNL